MLFLFLSFLFAMSQLTWAKPQCEQKYGIWATEADGVRHVVYGSDGVAYNSNVYFEEWRQSKLAWRASAKITCSNGAVTCYALVENASGLPGDDSTTDVVLEEIDENADGLPEWVVFAGLGQGLYYSGGAKVEWFNGFGPTEYDRITMPNIYRFLDCRERGELALFIPAGVSDASFFDQLLEKSKDRRVRAFITATQKPPDRIFRQRATQMLLRLQRRSRKLPSLVGGARIIRRVAILGFARREYRFVFIGLDRTLAGFV